MSKFLYLRKKIKKMLQGIIGKNNPIHRNRSIRLQSLVSYFFSRNLKQLGIIFGTDKSSIGYTDYYQEVFEKYRSQKFNLLEIGIGGNKSLLSGGASLRTWKKFFPRANIFGIDIYDKSFHQENRIKTFRGDQSDRDFLGDLARQVGKFKIIIDDGSHINDHIITSFEVLFPSLEDEGIYVIEDVGTSYRKRWGGDSNQMDAVRSSVNYFKNLIHGLNYNAYELDDYEPGYYDKRIVTIHFYRDIIFVFKGNNQINKNTITIKRYYDRYF